MKKINIPSPVWHVAAFAFLPAAAIPNRILMIPVQIRLGNQKKTSLMRYRFE